MNDIDIDLLFAGDPAPAPQPRPGPGATNGEWAAWYHAVGYRVGEDKPKSKQASKHREGDLGHRNTTLAVQSAWDRTPNANVAIRAGWQRCQPGKSAVYLAWYDADGKTADAWLRSRLTEAGILDSTPCVRRPGGDGAKYLLRHAYTTRSARLVVPGCANKGHDGLELLAAGRKATVAPSTHPDGGSYIWEVALPDDPGAVPYAPQALLDAARVESVTVKVPLDDDLVVRTSNGREMTVSEWREWMTATNTERVASVYVPASLRAGKVDNKVSGVLFCRDGRLSLYDSAAGTTHHDGQRAIGGRGDRQTDLDVSKFEIVVDRKLTLATCGHGECRRALRAARGIGGHYLCPIMMTEAADKARVVAIRGQIGIGKTTMISGFLRRLAKTLGREPKVLAISHRRSLVTHTIAAYELKTDYRGIEWREVPHERLESLGICLDSIDVGPGGKLRGHLVYSENFEIKNLQWDVVIIDECESVYRHLHSVRESHRIYRTLTSILKHHTNLVVLADATLSDYSITEFHRMVGPARKPTIAKNGGRVVKGHDVLIHDRRRRVDLDNPRLTKMPTGEDVEHAALALTAMDVPYYLHCTSKAEAVRLHKKLSGTYPSRKWPLVTGEHDDDDGEAFLADPNGWVRQHRGTLGAVIYTRAIESGVSITEPLSPVRTMTREDGKTSQLGEYDIVLVKASGEHSTWQDLVQAVGRPRRAREIVAYVADHGRAPWLHADMYRQALRDGHAYTGDVVMQSAIGPVGKIELQPLDADHLESHIATEVFEGQSRKDLGSDWWGYWHEQGCEVRDHAGLDADTIKALRDAARAERQVIREDAAETLVAAANDSMTVEEAEKILDRDSTPDERLAAHKTLLEDFFGREATKELALFDDRGRGRSKVRALVDTRLVAGGQTAKVAEHDAKALGTTAAVSRRHRTMAATITWHILQAFGVRSGHLDGTDTEATLDAGDLPRLHEWLSRPSTQRAVKLTLGIDVRGYLAGGLGFRRRKQVAGVGDPDLKATPATQVVEDDDELERLTEYLISGQVAGVGDPDLKATPATSDIDPADLEALMALTTIGTPDPIAGHQLWALAQQVARRLGLKFLSTPKKVAGKVVRVRTWDLAMAVTMAGYSKAEWDRHTSVPAGGVDPCLGTPEMVAALEWLKA